MPGSKKAKKVLSITLRISISIALLIFLFTKVESKEILDIIKTANFWLLTVAFLVFFLAYIISLYRWEMLLRVLHAHISIKRIIISFSGGLFFNLFLPSTIGGDLVRTFDLAYHTRKPKEIIATVILDRLSGYAGMVCVAMAALLFGYRLIHDKVVILVIGAVAVLLLIILLVVFNNFFFARISRLLHSPAGNRLRLALKDTHQEMYYFRRHKDVLFFNLIYSIALQMLTPLSFYFIALALGIKTQMIYFFIFIPVIGVIASLPISIAGLGLRDVSMIYFFAGIGWPKDLAFATSLVSFFFVIVIGAVGGLVYVFTLHNRRLQYHQAV